ASYTGGTKSVQEDRALIDYLIRHGHWSPFEMVEFTFYLEMPLFLVQQLLRHRTASINQESARYSILEEKYYVPETWRGQDRKNRQGSRGQISDADLADP
ncbi:MAG: thymidylate synthase (FAD), partial [Chloroflexota bacterium]